MPTEPSNPLEHVDFLSTLPRPGGPAHYVTSAVCKECHADQHRSWHRSYHRSMTQIVSTNSVVADFGGVRLDYRGERFTLDRSGNEFFVTIEDIPQPGQPPPPASEAIRIRMSMVTGSHHMQVFWLPGGHGNDQIGFPFTWLIEDRRWVPRNDAFIRDPNQAHGREVWNLTCVRCHTTGGQPRPDREHQRFDSRAVELGIACEACHGPGEKHVHHQRERARLPAGQRPKEDRDSTIVHPEHLPPKRASHICGFCHSMKWFDRNEGWQESGFRFRPGDDLDTTTPVIRPGRLADQPWLKPVLEKHPALLDDFFWPDGMIRVAGREYNGLIESACHQRGNLSCLSCHSLHDSDPNDQLAKGMDGNQACLQCHKSHASQLQQHTHHPAGSAGSLCYNCHMPHTSYALLKAVRSHQITSPNVQVTLDSGRPNACNACHVDQTLEWTSQHLARWYGQTPVQVPDLHRTTSATVRALLAGDAGQRALAAWHLGWTDAQQAAGNHWQPALLAFLLDDPYAAVRYIAQRSLRRHPTFAQLDYDFVGKSDHWQRAKTQVLERWRNLKPATVATNHLHIALTPDGGLDTTRVNRLQATRDNRPIRLRE